MSFDTFSPDCRLERLPDNITLLIMFYLDALSLIRFSRVCKRFYHLSQEDILWSNVDMSTLPYMDIKKTKKFIVEKLSPNLRTITIESNYGLKAQFRLAHKPKETQSTSSPRYVQTPSKPKIDISVLNVLMEKCPKLCEIKLRHCDLTAIDSENCTLTSSQNLQKLSIINCYTHVRWLDSVRWPNLQCLSLASTVKSSEWEIKSIIKQLSTSIVSLNLSGCYRINDDCVNMLCSSQPPLSLCVLHLSGTGISDNCLPYLVKLPHLKELYLSNMNGLTGDGVAKLPDLLPYLRVVDISFLDKVKSNVCLQVAERMKNTKVITTPEQFKYNLL